MEGEGVIVELKAVSPNVSWAQTEASANLTTSYRQGHFRKYRYRYRMWQIKSVFKKDKTGIRNGQRQYYSDFI